MLTKGKHTYIYCTQWPKTHGKYPEYGAKNDDVSKGKTHGLFKFFPADVFAKTQRAFGCMITSSNGALSCQKWIFFHVLAHCAIKLSEIP